MIDFRYHLVSIVAVFLALAIGLVLGSTALSPSVLSGLERTSAAEKNTIDRLYGTQHQLQQQIAGDQQFAQAAAPQLISQLLAGSHVVLVTAPGAPGSVTSGITDMLGLAGAKVTGQVQLQPKFFEAASSTQADLTLLAERLAPPGMTLSPGTPQAQASQVLASALMTKDGPGQPPAGQRDPGAAAILSGFAAGGFLTVSGQPAARATLAVVIIPAAPPAEDDSNPASQGLVTFAQHLRQASQGTVVAGTIAGSGAGSAIDVMRSGGRAGHMSSVDDADTVIGQIVVAQALFGQAHGVSGSYGTASTANAAGPSPAPSPSPTASAVLRTIPRHPAHPTTAPSRSAGR